MDLYCVDFYSFSRHELNLLHGSLIKSRWRWTLWKAQDGDDAYDSGGGDGDHC